MAHIAPFHKATPSAAFVDETWQRLRQAIIQIQNHNESSLSYEELYRCGYNLVLHRHGAKLYAGLIDLLSQQMHRLAASVESSPNLLCTLLRVWKEHLIVMQMIRDVLLYVDHNYVPREKRMPVFDLGLSHFNDEVVHNPAIYGPLREALLGLVDSERSGDLVDRSLLHDAVAMLVALGLRSLTVYEDLFEREFVARSAAYFKAEGLRLVAQRNAPAFLAKTEALLRDELGRVRECLHATTGTRVLETLYGELVEPHLLDVMGFEGTGLATMLDNYDTPSLQRLHTLCMNVRSGLKVLGERIGAHVTTVARQIVTEEKEGAKPIALIVRFMDLRLHYDKILVAALASNKEIQRIIIKVLATCFNEHPRAGECMSIFVDDVFRRSGKKMSDEEVEDILNRFMALFRLLQDKDVFEGHYRVHMARRLLSRTTSEDHERSLIVRLKMECGSYYTAKAEGMYADFLTSRDGAEEFAAHLKSEKITLGFDFAVSVLTQNHWPTNQPIACSLPAQLCNAAAAFESFYLARRTGRKLKWHHSLGSAEVVGWFRDGTQRHVLCVSTMQMAVLLCFADPAVEALSFTQLSELTRLPETDLRRALQSLALGKTRVLAKTTSGRDIEAPDAFRRNDTFSHPSYRVKIAQIAQRDPVASQAVSGKVELDRTYLMDATLVRIMKARKTLSHNALIAEACEQLQTRFAPNPAALKRCIDSLIEREYLARMEDRSMYKYLA